MAKARFLMTISITVGPEVEHKLAERAAARGLALEEYAREVLEREVTAVTMRELFAPVREDVAESGISEEDLDTLLDTARDRAYEARQAHRD